MGARRADNYGEKYVYRPVAGGEKYVDRGKAFGGACLKSRDRGGGTGVQRSGYERVGGRWMAGGGRPAARVAVVALGVVTLSVRDHAPLDATAGTAIRWWHESGRRLRTRAGGTDPSRTPGMTAAWCTMRGPRDPSRPPPGSPVLTPDA